MSALAMLHLKQARTFLRAGDAVRAVELLEKARALARDDRKVLREILDALVVAYHHTGDHEKALRCSDALERMGGPLNNPMTVPVPNTDVSHAPDRSNRQLVLALATMLLLAGVAIGSLWFLHRRAASAAQSKSADASGVTTHPVQSALAPSTPQLLQGIVPTSAPAVAQMNNEDVKSCVGLLLVVGHYEGNVRGARSQIDIPFQSGTTFVVRRGGMLLTNKHVISSASDIPGSLEELKMPTMTLRETKFIACFGSEPDDWSEATVAFKSDRFDVALLRTDRRFPKALPWRVQPPKQAEEIFAWGYPGVVNDFFLNLKNQQPIFQKFIRTHSIGIQDCLTPESFKATLTRGIVSVEERVIDGASYLQTDTTINHGSSGGPMVDKSGEIIAISTLGLVDKAAGYNFGLLVDQLQDELTPYMKGD